MTSWWVVIKAQASVGVCYVAWASQQLVSFSQFVELRQDRTGDAQILQRNAESKRDTEEWWITRCWQHLSQDLNAWRTRCINTLTVIIICQKIWTSKQWRVDWTQSLIIPILKTGNTRHCQNYRTISLISHSKQVKSRVILNRLGSQAEHILGEEQGGFRTQKSTTEEIFNLRLLVEKHFEHQKELFHNFINIKKAFDHAWHDGLERV